MTASMMAAGDAARRADGTAEQRLATVIGLMFEPPLFSRASLKAWLALWGEAAVNPKLKSTHRRSYESYRRALVEAIGEIATERKLSSMPASGHHLYRADRRPVDRMVF